MTFRGYRLLIILAVLVVTLAALLTGNHFFRRETVDGPLQRRCLEVDGVEAVSLDRNGQIDNVKVRLAEVSDLRHTYRQIDRIATDLLGDRFEITVEDARTPELTVLYHDIHFLVYEAIATGNYSRLAPVATLIESNGAIGARLTVDEQVVYVQIHDGEGNYLYELVRRPEAGGEERP